jgi:hypothetical protein
MNAAPFQCSFVELMADGPQKPVWFVSHAWSTNFKDSLEMLDYHMQVQDLDDKTPYWYCGFAVSHLSVTPITPKPLAIFIVNT